MKYLRSPLFFLLFLFNGLVPLKAAELSLETTDPVNLSISWWSKFQDDPNNKDNIDELINRLKTLKSQLETDNNSLTVIQIDQLIVSAEQLESKRKEVPDFTPTHPLYLSSYTLSEWLKVSHKQIDLENEKNQISSQVKLLKQKISTLRNELDYLQLEYPVKKEGTLEKLITGLKIMNLRFQIEVHELEIKRLSKISNFVSDDLAKLTQERKTAYERLNFSTLNEADINSKLTQAQNLLVEANQNLLDINKEKETDTVFSTESLGANINIQNVKAQILLEEAKLLIFELVHNTDKTIAKQSIESRLYQLQEDQERLLTSFKNLKDEALEAPLSDLKQHNNIETSLQALKTKVSDSKLLLSIVEDKVIEKKTTFFQYLTILSNKITDSLKFILSGLSFKLFRINDYPVTPWVILRALGIFGIAIFLSQYLTNSLSELLQKKDAVGAANTYILSRILRYALFIIGLVAASYSIGIGMTNFVIIAGALGVGVGLGLQAIVNNFFSGLVVLFSKLLKVGDIIEASGDYKGVVKAIRTQNTHIRTFEGKDVVIPNAQLVSQSVVNWTLSDPFIRLKIPFSVAYGTNKERVEQIVLDIAKKFKFTMNNELICPTPKVWLENHGSNALNLALVVWVNIRENTSRGSMQAEYLWEIEKELSKAGIEIPFPHTDIYVKDFPDKLVL